MSQLCSLRHIGLPSLSFSLLAGEKETKSTSQGVVTGHVRVFCREDGKDELNPLEVCV